MKLPVTFTENNCHFIPQFGEAVIIGGDEGNDAYDRGYENGHSAGVAEGYQNGKTDGIAEGKQAEYDRFWDVYQANGTRTSYVYAFAGQGWNRETFKPKHSMQPKKASYMFAAMNINSNKQLDLVVILAEQNVSIDFSQCSGMGYCFYQALIIRIGKIDLSSAEDVTSVFNSAYLLTIEELIPPPIAMSATCWQANLENLTIGGTITKNMNLSRCRKLTDASVQSIIDHLADLTGQTAQTLTLHPDVKAKLTEEQLATITGKNWSVA